MNRHKLDYYGGSRLLVSMICPMVASFNRDGYLQRDLFPNGGLTLNSFRHELQLYSDFKDDMRILGNLHLLQRVYL
jgi:hypothetical protein